MPSTRKILSLIVLLAAGVFSTASISTAYYYHSSQVSGLQCQEGSIAGPTAGILTHTTRGLVNRSTTDSAFAYCPVSLAAGNSYNLNTIIYSRAGQYRGSVSCQLFEVDTLSGDKMAVYTNQTYVPGKSTGIMSWYGIEPTVSGSSFTLRCKLIPGTGIISTSVSKY